MARQATVMDARGEQCTARSRSCGGLQVGLTTYAATGEHATRRSPFVEHSNQRQIGAHRATNAGKIHCKHVRRPQVGPVEKFNGAEELLTPEIEGKHEISPVANEQFDQMDIAQRFAAHHNGYIADLPEALAIGKGSDACIDPKRCCRLSLRNCTETREVVAPLQDCIEISDIQGFETTDIEQRARDTHRIASFAQGRVEWLVSGTVAASGMNGPALQQVYNGNQSHGSVGMR